MKLAMRLAELAAQGYLIRVEQHPANPQYVMVTLSKMGWSRRAHFDYARWKENDVVEAMNKLDAAFREFFKVQQKLAEDK